MEPHGSNDHLPTPDDRFHERGTTVTIQGMGFTTGETVNLTPQLSQPPSGTTYNPPVAATIVTNPPTELCPPYLHRGDDSCGHRWHRLHVTVTTPGGTSQTAASDSTSFVPTFTYSPAAPTVSGLVGTVAGSITGNTTVTIQGTGFWNAPNNQFPAQVFFCPTGGANAGIEAECSGGLSGGVVGITPPSRRHRHSTRMTALTPAGELGRPYYVQVEVYNVYSTQTNATNPSNVFTYSVQAPLIVSMSPLSGSQGHALTISGANFLSGSTGGLLPRGQVQPPTSRPACIRCRKRRDYPLRMSRSTAPIQLVVSVPTLAAGTSYYPIVTLPAPTYNSTPAVAALQRARRHLHVLPRRFRTRPMMADRMALLNRLDGVETAPP